VDIGVDFVDDTVDEEIVIALVDEGGRVCFGAGVAGAEGFEGRCFAV
jgi:hypothetical protein